MRFKVILYTSEEGVAVNAPSLPGCWSQGATETEALTNIPIAIREYLETDGNTTQDPVVRGDVREVEVPV
jgi:predicted RNase H-like HicB family nuclease